MNTRNDINSLSFAERLNRIHNLRLMRNTTDELSAHTGIQLGNNSFSRKSPFITRCIYSEFAREVAERTGFDLDDLLTNYAKASAYYEKIKGTKRSQPEFHRIVLRCLLDEKFAETADKAYRTAAKAAADFNQALLLLLITDLIPTFRSRTGDVAPTMLLEQLTQLRDFLRPLYTADCTLPFAPYLIKQYKTCVRRIHDGERFTRLDLIYFAVDIYANLENNYIPQQNFLANQYIYQHLIHPDLESGIWCERDCGGTNPTYWFFDYLGGEYIVIRKEFNRRQRQVKETYYELSIWQDEEPPSFLLYKEDQLSNLLQGQPLSEKAYMLGSIAINDQEHPTSLELTFHTNCYEQFPTRLTRIADRADRSFMANLTNGTWTTIYDGLHAEYFAIERVITAYYIYLEYASETLPDGRRRVTSWVRIPRTGLLEQADIGTPMARIHYDQRIYLEIIPQNYIVDITDEASIQQAGLDIVDSIEVEYTEPQTDAPSE